MLLQNILTRLRRRGETFDATMLLVAEWDDADPAGTLRPLDQPDPQLGAATGDDDRSGRRAVAVLQDLNGQRVGVAIFRERHGRVSVRAAVWRLAPDFRGFHVHAVGECVAPFASAGGHFNPADAGHGDHAGDLPSLLVNEDGRAELRFMTDRFSLADLFDGDGSALIVHSGRDNYANIPSRYHSHATDTFGPDADTLATGDAGGRVACGVVRRSGHR